MSRSARAWVSLIDPLLVPLLLELADERGGNLSGEQLRLSRLEAMRALALLGQGVAWEGMQHLRKLVDSLSGREQLPVVALPAGLQAELRPYQIEGFEWMSRLAHWGAGICLADDMGLGKTVQAILALPRRSRVVVVCPAAVKGVLLAFMT